MAGSFRISSSSAADKFKADLSDLFEDATLAKGKGVLVKRSQLDEAFIAYKANLTGRGQQVPESERTLREAQLLDRLIVTQLLTNRVNDGDRLAARTLADKFTADSKKAASSPEAFTRQLKAMGMTAERFDQRVWEQALSEAVIDREVKLKIPILDSQVEDFYKTGSDVLARTLQAELERLAKNSDTPARQLAELKQNIDDVRKQNLARLELPEKVRVSHILLMTRKRDSEEELGDEEKKARRQQIDKLRNRALNGDDFAKLVQDFSEDRNLKETKGEYTFTRNDSLVPEFKAAAFALGVGQISEVVTSVFGYHVIKLLDRVPAKKTDLDAAKKEIKDFLLQQEMQRQLPEFFTRLKKEASVEILAARFKGIELPKNADPLKP